MRINIISGAILSSLLLFSSCIPREPNNPPAPKAETKVVEETVAPQAEVAVAAAETAAVEVAQVKPDIERGRTLYMANCLSCHNKDPSIKGSIGPEQTDAPLDVMQVKIVTGRYPPVLPEGFTPKRKTKAMRAFPKLKDDVVHIYAWIQSMKKK